MAGKVRAQKAVLSAGVAGLACWSVGLLSQLLVGPPLPTPALWPTAGVAYGLLVLGGARLWPAVFVGVFLADCGAVFQLDHSLSPRLLAFVLIGSLAATIQGLLAFAMARSMDHPRRLAVISRYLILVGPICCILTASVSVTAQKLLGLPVPAPLWQVWCSGWLSDTLSVLILAPLIPAWKMVDPKLRYHRFSFVAVPLIAVLALLLYFTLLVRRDEVQRVTTLFHWECEVITENLDQRLSEASQALDYVAVLVGSTANLDQELFQKMARCGLSKNESLVFLGWAPKMQNADMELRDLLHQITVLEPGGANGRVANINAPINPMPKMELEQICRRGNLYGRLLPTDKFLGKQPGSLLLVLPVYTAAGGSRNRCEQLVGYLVSQLDLALLTRPQTDPPAHALSHSSVEGWTLRVKLGDLSGTQSEPDYRQTLDFAGLDLELDFSMSLSHRTGDLRWKQWALLIPCFLFTGLLSAWLLWYPSQTMNLVAIENRRTKDLAQSLFTLEREIEYQAQAESARAWERAQGAFPMSGSTHDRRIHEIHPPMDPYIGKNRPLWPTGLNTGPGDGAEPGRTDARTRQTFTDEGSDLSLAEMEGVGLERVQFHLPTLIREIAETSDLASPVKVQITLHPEVPEYCRGGQDKLRQAMQYLIQDGMKSNKKKRISRSCHLVGLNGEAVQLRIQIKKRIHQEQAGTASPSRVASDTEGAPARESRLPILGLVLDLVPMQESQVADATVKPEQKGSYRRRHKVLIVENNAMAQKKILTLLKDQNYELTMASHGHEALSIMGKRVFDLILMECQMPEMDGYEATAAIRMRHGNRTPIIAMTARIIAGERDKCLAVGMNDCLSKPLNPDELHEKIRYWLPGWKDQTGD